MFFATVVQPLLQGHRYAAGPLGPGSEIFGFDSPRSTDHGWGPRLRIFVSDADDIAAVAEMLANRLPGAARCDRVRIGAARSWAPANRAARKPPTGTEIVLETDDVTAERDRVVATGWPLESNLTDRTSLGISPTSGYTTPMAATCA